MHACTHPTLTQPRAVATDAAMRLLGMNGLMTLLEWSGDLPDPDPDLDLCMQPSIRMRASMPLFLCCPLRGMPACVLQEYF